MTLRYIVLTASFVLLGLPGRALAADSVDSCVADHVEGQLLRNQGRLVAAQARFFECAKSDCPALVRDECVGLVQEVESVMPSVLLGALDENGQPTLVPMVSIDGSPVLVPLDDRSVALDPGQHHIVFQHPNGTVREVTLSLAESERDRAVVADFRPLPSAWVAPSGEPQKAPFDEAERAARTDRETKGVLRSGVLVSGGVAALAFGSFTYFALSGRTIEKQLDRCKPNCENPDDLDRMRVRYLVADVSLGVGLISAGIAAYAWATAPSSEQRPLATREATRWHLVAAPGRVGLSASGEF